MVRNLNDAAETQSSHHESPSIQFCRTQNKYDMSVTPPVSHVEMWPYIASAAPAFESHSVRADLIVPSSMVMTPLPPHLTATAAHATPHNVDLHGVESNGPGQPRDAPRRSTSSATHQPRFWSKLEAL